MKVCCELGKCAALMTDVELMGCNHDHCKGMIEVVEYSQEIGLYELDDGEITDEQIETIRKVSSATGVTRENFDKRLFE